MKDLLTNSQIAVYLNSDMRPLYTGALTQSFNQNLYYRDSSFTLFSGEWSNKGEIFSIDTAGGITGTFKNCQFSGTFAIIDNDRNLYVLDADLAQCEYRGQYSGLAIDDDAQNDLLIAVLSNDQYYISMAIYRQ
jgi:hypothetical protein